MCTVFTVETYFYDSFKNIICDNVKKWKSNLVKMREKLGKQM